MVRSLLSLVIVVSLFACSGGSDNSTSSQTAPPPGSTSPQPIAQAGRFNGPVSAMTPVPNGNGDIYVAGHFTTYNNQPVRPVVRLRPDGTLNDSFKLTDTVSAVSSTTLIPAIAAADDGSGDLYIAEVFVGIDDSPDDKAQVWKVTSGGAMASGFTSGTARDLGSFPTPTHTDILALVPVGDGSGRVYVGGLFSQYNQTPVVHLVRLNTNGTIDPTFNASASTTSAPGVRDLLPAKDGSGDLYVMSYGWADDGGATPTLGSLSVYRRNADGTQDPSFATFTSFDRLRFFALVEDGSGDIFVSGRFVRCCGIDGTVPGFVRLNPDGTVDQTSPRPQTGFPRPMAKATDGTNDWFVVTNVVNTTDGTLAGSLVERYKADGPLDSNFTVGQTNIADTSQCTVINHVLCNGIEIVMPAPDATGDVYVAGGFTTYNSIAVGHIVRVNANGTLE
jgi:hypothetical protein